MQVEVRAGNFGMEAAETTIHKDSGSDAGDSSIKMNLNLDAITKQEEKEQSVGLDVFAVIHQEQFATPSSSSAFSTHSATFCPPSISTQDDNHSISSSILSTADVPKRGILVSAFRHFHWNRNSKLELTSEVEDFQTFKSPKKWVNFQKTAMPKRSRFA